MNSKHLVCASVTCCQLASCMVMSPLPYTPGSGATLPTQVGQLVTVHTRDAEIEMVVSRISTDELCSIDLCVRIDQIQRIERKEFSVTRTAATWLGTAFFVAATFFRFHPWSR